MSKQDVIAVQSALAEQTVASIKDLQWKTSFVLALACCIHREKSFTSTSKYIAADPNGDQRWTNKDMLTYSILPQLANENYNLKFSPTEEDRALADTIIKHFRKLTFGVIADSLNDYMDRVFKSTQNEWSNMTDFGVLASVPQLYEKEVTEKYIKQEIANTVKGHIAEIGNTVILNIRYIRSKPLPNLECYSHEAITDNNYLVSFLSKNLLGVSGSTQQIRANIKKHGENFLTKTPETQLNYVKVIDRSFVWQ